MDLESTKQAVEIAKSSKTKLESSGGLTLENARAYARPALITLLSEL